MNKRRWQQTHGQATAEVVIGLVGLSVVFFGVMQISRTGDTSIANLLEARAAAEQAAAPGNLSPITYRYVADWRDGDDGLRYTADDQPIVALNDDLGVYRRELESPLSLRGLSLNPEIGLRDEVTPALSSDSLAGAAGLCLAARPASVPVEPALRRLLLLPVDTLSLTDEAAMPKLSGLTPQSP